MNIGFDLDNIFVNTPPFLPSKVIELLYRKHITKTQLEYRIPGRIETYVRILSHVPILRPPIRNNIKKLKEARKKNNDAFYLISGRFNFLKEKTDQILSLYDIKDMFKEVRINSRNEQPHNFKNRVIKKMKIARYIDDDLPLLQFISKHNDQCIFYWLNKHSNKKIHNNLIAITDFSFLFK